MIAAVDVHYRDPRAVAAGVLFTSWESERAEHELAGVINQAAPYVPGQLFRRELPPILRLLESCPTLPKVIIVDGFVWLGREGEQEKKGLGAHLYEALDRKAAVVGIAKNRFRGAGPLREVVRGQSKKPLFVSAAGLAVETAAMHVEAMHGQHRIPTMVRAADQLCRVELSRLTNRA